MRIMLLAAVAALSIPSLPALADQNFIPLGQNYAPGDDKLPPLNSEQDKFNAQVDIYQAEIYVRQKSQKVFDSRMYNLSNQQNPADIDDDHLDY